jgi:hypothetical protein
MKLYVDTGSKQVNVTKEATEKLEQNGRQKTERGTGRLAVHGDSGASWGTHRPSLDQGAGRIRPPRYWSR